MRSFFHNRVASPTFEKFGTFRLTKCEANARLSRPFLPLKSFPFFFFFFVGGFVLF